MKTYKWKIVMPTTRGQEETKQTNIFMQAIMAIKRGWLVINNETDLEDDSLLEWVACH